MKKTLPKINMKDLERIKKHRAEPKIHPIDEEYEGIDY